MRVGAARRAVLEVSIVHLFAVCLALIGAWLAQDLGHWWWHVSVFGVSAVLQLMCAVYWFRIKARVLIAIFSVMQALLAIVVGTGMLDVRGMTANSRVQLFYDNPNFLGASLSVTCVSALTLLPRRWGLPIAIMCLAAIPFTGARLPMAAAITGILIWGILSANSRWRRGGIKLLAALSIGGFLIVMSGPGSILGSRNLLALSSNFDHEQWTHSANLAVHPAVVQGPFPGTMADRLVVEADAQSSLVLLQRALTSVDGVPYVASVYVRSDRPQSVVLSSHVSSTVCEVDNSWGRCATPAGYGNNRTSLQFRLETTEKHGAFDIYAWGAQVERGLEASPIQERRLVPLISPSLLARYRITSWLPSGDDPYGRVRAWGIGLEQFVESPLVGHGLGLESFATAFGERYPGVELVEHSHNSLLHLLSTVGILGLCSWALPSLSVFTGVSVYGRRSLIPMVGALVVLGLFDNMLFNAGVFYITWLHMGLVRFHPSNILVQADRAAWE